ncbi:uncharacterized protein IWZ02DRAFT_369790 [Phyllosticta citriasiana]|uniref:uncharacterized protein n=1 Tax=Phyllosticta citriasiana TaxID=595635 RepID=UPI0030FDC0E3
MLQTSISAWLQKPKAVCEPAREAVQPEPQQKKCKLDNDTAANNNESPPEGKKAHCSRIPRPCDSKSKDPKADAKARPQHLPTNPLLRPLPPNVEIAHINASTLHSFRRLNSLLLEISYPAKFYDETLSDPVVHGLSLAAFWRDDVGNKRTTTSTSTKSATAAPPRKPILVAGIRCRVLEPSTLPGPVLYIATLATLSPYRGLGLAGHLLARVTGAAVREHGVQTVVAHVWERNEEGLAWYRARGFEVLGKEDEYYRRLRPTGAWVVRRRIGVADLLGEDGRCGDDVTEREGEDDGGGAVE